MKMILHLAVCCAGLLLTACSKDKPSDKPEYRFTESIMIDGITRTYIVGLPKNYYADETGRALVIGLHGTGGNAEQFENAYGFREQADAGGFVLVYANGVTKADGSGLFDIRTWNAGSCCDYAMYSNINDVKFISMLIDQLVARLRINSKRVYVAGMSNGGMMAYRLAAELPHKIAAVGVVSGTMVAEKANPSGGTVPIVHIHAAADTKVPFAGGIGIGNYNFPPVMEGIHYWVTRNKCLPDPVAEQFTDYRLQTWKNSEGQTLLQCYLTADGGHSWPSSQQQGRRGDPPSRAIHATRVLIDFFNRFSLP